MSADQLDGKRLHFKGRVFTLQISDAAQDGSFAITAKEVCQTASTMQVDLDQKTVVRIVRLTKAEAERRGYELMVV